MENEFSVAVNTSQNIIKRQQLQWSCKYTVCLYKINNAGFVWRSKVRDIERKRERDRFERELSVCYLSFMPVDWTGQSIMELAE